MLQFWRSEVQSRWQWHWQRCVSSAGFGGESVSRFCELLEAARVPWLAAPSSICKASGVESSDLSDSDPPAFLFHSKIKPPSFLVTLNSLP